MKSLNVLLFLSAALPVSAQPFHPADQDNDRMISLSEVTAYAKAHREGVTLPGGQSPVTVDDLERARFIWQNGERYRQVPGVPEAHSWVPDPLDGPIFLTTTDLQPFPFDAWELFGLPPDQTGLILEYQVEGQVELRYAPLENTDDDRWIMRVPFVFSAPGGAAPMDLWVVSEFERYPVVSLRPTPLEPVPGALGTIANQLTRISDQLGEFLGGDPSQYHSTPPEGIPENLRALAMVDRVLRDAGNPNNLVRVLDGTAPMLQEYGVNMDELEMVLGHMGLIERLEQLQSLLSAPPSEPLQQEGLMRQLSSRELAPANFSVRVTNLKELSAAMILQCEADKIANPSREVQRVKNGAKLSAIVAGIAGGPVGAVGAAAFSVGDWAIENYHVIIANQYPSIVDNGQITFTPSFLPEDDCTPATWITTLDARSREWSLDKTVVTGLLTALGSFKAGSELFKSDAKLGLRENFVEKANELEKTIADALSGVSEVALDSTFPDTNIIPMPAQNWNRIPITAADIGMFEVTFEGDSVMQALQLDQIIPVGIGRTLVRIRTLPGVLGPCGGIEGAAVDFEVLENKVTLSPGGGQVKPDEEITFTATVSDADNLDLEFEVSHGTMLEESYNLGTGVHTLKWQAPAQNQMPDGPITITARSLAEECLREGVERSRVATFTPFKTDYVLLPASVSCLPEGSAETFEVVDIKFGEVPPVAWELIGSGNLAPNGPSALFTAGEPGQVTVRATFQAAEGLVVLEQTFTVGCELSTTWLFVSTAQPVQGGSFGSLSAGFLVSDVGAVVGDVFIEYTSVEPPTGGSPVGQVSGTFSGAGMFIPADIAEAAALFDETEAERTYTGTTSQGGTAEYSVIAGFFMPIFDAYEGDIRLPDGANGSGIQIQLDGSGSFAGGFTGFEDNEIVQYNWSFSDGEELSGAEVTKTFSRSLEELTITLRVVDKRGNWAETKQTLIIVQVFGAFSFPYEPSGLSVATFLWDFEGVPAPPPEFTEEGYAVFTTDPAQAGVIVEITGGRTAIATADTSLSSIIDEEDRQLYSIGFLPTGGFGEE